MLRLHKSRSADVRLRIPYDEFCNSPYDKIRQLYIDHLVDSVLALKSRMKNKAELNELYEIAETIASIK